MKFRQYKKPVQLLTSAALVAVPLLLGVSLIGCAQNSGYQVSLASAADNAQGSFTLPRGEDVGAPISLWEKVLVVCPYSDTDLVPALFAKDAQNIDTASTDSVQWLLFSEQSNIVRISVERAAIDFCQGESRPIEYESNRAWSAVKHDGAWVMTPIAD